MSLHFDTECCPAIDCGMEGTAFICINLRAKYFMSLLVGEKEKAAKDQIKG